MNIVEKLERIKENSFYNISNRVMRRSFLLLDLLYYKPNDIFITDTNEIIFEYKSSTASLKIRVYNTFIPSYTVLLFDKESCKKVLSFKERSLGVTEEFLLFIKCCLKDF